MFILRTLSYPFPAYKTWTRKCVKIQNNTLFHTQKLRKVGKIVQPLLDTNEKMYGLLTFIQLCLKKSHDLFPPDKIDKCTILVIVNPFLCFYQLRNSSQLHKIRFIYVTERIIFVCFKASLVWTVTDCDTICEGFAISDVQRSVASLVFAQF